MRRVSTKFWRESASVIALAKNAPRNGHAVDASRCNYKILLQQRSHKSGFLPSTIVFPGGVVEDCDFVDDWRKHFASHGFAENQFEKFQSENALVPPILQDETNSVSRHMSLRITAIREAFEELGVLMCRQRNDISDKYAKYITDFDVKHWQDKVHKDPVEFISLCQHLDCYPDIWSLYLWCNWLTPIGYESQRFDTIFFLTAFENPPPVFAHESEVVQVRWQSPEVVIENFENKKLMLPPPQWYEISKLKNQKDLDTLIDFSAKRSWLGCEQIYPILLNPKKGKGHIAIFPGDELYPKKPDFEKQTIVHLDDKTIDELQESAKYTHRMELYDLHTLNVKLKNFKPYQCQLSPISNHIPNLDEFNK